MILPGCRSRQVVQVERRGQGAMLKLDCGHSQWMGSYGNQTIRPCLEGPCYRPVRDMGD